MRILNLIQSGDSCGWGVCGANLEKEFQKERPGFEVSNKYHQRQMQIASPEGDSSLFQAQLDSGNINDFDALLVPVINGEWSYPQNHLSIIDAAVAAKKPIIGYAFHEFDKIGRQQIHRLPMNYTALACGSDWMRDWVKMALEDVATDFPVVTVHQGVESASFQPVRAERPPFMEGMFVIASAGKFELRKGQDVVIEAFKRFRKEVPNSLLTMAWDNPWPETMLTMRDSPWITMDDIVLQGYEGHTYIAGVNPKLIPAANQSVWRIGKNSEMAPFYQVADIGVFPNRCEAGTNLCLMEALACGLPCCGTYGTGHMDVVDAIADKVGILEGFNPYKAWDNGRDKEWNWGNWVEPCINKVVSDMYYLYQCRDKFTDENRTKIAKSMESFTWDSTASKLLDLCKSVVK